MEADSDCDRDPSLFPTTLLQHKIVAESHHFCFLRKSLSLILRNL